MKLSSIQIEKYRSIISTEQLKLDDKLTVIVGPNNEGKSNVLRAIVLALGVLQNFRLVRKQPEEGKNEIKYSFRLPLESYKSYKSYNWEEDFPIQLQTKEPEGETVLKIVFELTNQERAWFKNSCGSSINGDLPIEIRMSNNKGIASIKVKKQGKGAESYEKNTPKIAAFVNKHFKFEYIPAIRTEKDSLDVVQKIIDEELSSLQNQEEYKNALKTIDAFQKPIFDRISNDLQKNLKTLLPSVKKVKISSPQNGRYISRFRSPEFTIDDGAATALAAKGDGIKSLVAISLIRSTHIGKNSGSLVVAIEEPESHLHPSAARELAKILGEMSQEHQVIITTHSPLLVSKADISSNLIVSASKARPANSIKEIRSCLGIEISDNLSSAEYVILVEGTKDIRILKSLFLISNLKKEISEGRLAFDDLNGASNIAYKISSLSQLITTPIILLDDDQAGRSAQKKAEGTIPSKFIFSWNRPKKDYDASEIENFINPLIYWDEIQSEFAVTLDLVEFKKSRTSWTETMKGLFEKSGKTWNASIESNAKTLVCQAVGKAPNEAIAEEHSATFQNISDAISKLVKAV